MYILKYYSHFYIIDKETRKKVGEYWEEKKDQKEGDIVVGQKTFAYFSIPEGDFVFDMGNPDNKYWELMQKYIGGSNSEGHNPVAVSDNFDGYSDHQISFVYEDGSMSDVFVNVPLERVYLNTKYGNDEEFDKKLFKKGYTNIVDYGMIIDAIEKEEKKFHFDMGGTTMNIIDKEHDYDDQMPEKKIEYRGVFDIGSIKYRVYFMYSENLDVQKNCIFAVYERGKKAGYVKYYVYTEAESSEKIIKEFISNCIKMRMNFIINYLKKILADNQIIDDDNERIENIINYGKELELMRKQIEGLMSK